MDITYRKIASDDQGTVYDVLLDGERIGEVSRVRVCGQGWTTRTRGYTNHDGYGVGHWEWTADTAPEGGYPTRAEAVADMAAVRAARAAA